MMRQRMVTILAAFVAVLVTSALPLEATDPLHEARSPAAVAWDTTFAWAQAEVTVAGPAGTVSWTIPAGDPLRIDAADLVEHARRAGLEPDGLYRYEIVLAPTLDEATRALMARAREAGDEQTVEQLRARGVLPRERVAASGHFRLDGGLIVVDQGETERPSANQARPAAAERASGAAPTEPPSATTQGIADGTTRDSLIYDDLIVTGSECIGFDCVNGESFGYDTLKLKENNLRIKFEDTSVGSFPTGDWMIAVNDTTSGGASYFSVMDVTNSRTPFKIETNAPSNSLYVEDYGRVGLGTSIPYVELHIVDGDTPTVRLDQDGSSGWAAQRWDMAGNETNFFIRDVTNGSKLSFRIQPNAPSNTLCLKEGGKVGVGTWSPDAQLHTEVPSGTAVGLKVEAIGSLGSDHASLHLTQSGSSTPSDWDIRANATTGALEVKEGGHASLKFQKGAANNSIVVGSAPSDGVVRVGIGTVTPGGNAGVSSLDVNGSIFQRGGQLHADYVFAPGYDLETIADHAAAMWRERHLPAVPGRRVDGEGREVIEVGSQARGMLEELEKAHIYIEQLSTRLEEVETANAAKDATITGLEQRLAEVEAALARLTAQ